MRRSSFKVEGGNLPSIPFKLRIQREYAGHMHKIHTELLNKTGSDVFAQEDEKEDFFPEIPSQILVKENTHRKTHKDWRWRSIQYNAYRNEKDLFQELVHEIETIDVDEYINCIKHVLENSMILRDHVDVIGEFNKEMFSFKQDLYTKIKKITNEKYKIILTNKLNALWQ